MYDCISIRLKYNIWRKQEREKRRMFKSKNVTAIILKISGLLVFIGAIAVGIMTGKSYGPLYPATIVFFSGLMTAAPGLIGAVVLYGLGEIIDLMRNIKDKVAPAEQNKDAKENALDIATVEETLAEDDKMETAEGTAENHALTETDEEAAGEALQGEKQ